MLEKYRHRKLFHQGYYVRVNIYEFAKQRLIKSLAWINNSVHVGQLLKDFQINPAVFCSFVLKPDYICSSLST
jgi:hypothetical protein